MISQRAAGPIFLAPLSTSVLSTSNGWDVLQITASSSSRFELLGIDLSLASTQFASGSAIALQLLRGSTAASTGAAITPRNVKGWPNTPTPNLTVAGPSSGLTSTASAVLLWSGAFDSMGRLSYRPRDREERERDGHATGAAPEVEWGRAVVHVHPMVARAGRGIKWEMRSDRAQRKSPRAGRGGSARVLRTGGYGQPTA